jgi:hypothetical protein
MFASTLEASCMFVGQITSNSTIRGNKVWLYFVVFRTTFESLSKGQRANDKNSFLSQCDCVFLVSRLSHSFTSLIRDPEGLHLVSIQSEMCLCLESSSTVVVYFHVDPYVHSRLYVR